MLVSTFLPIILYILVIDVFSFDILSLEAMSYLGDLHERFLAQTLKCQFQIRGCVLLEPIAGCELNGAFC